MFWEIYLIIGLAVVTLGFKKLIAAGVAVLEKYKSDKEYHFIILLLSSFIVLFVCLLTVFWPIFLSVSVIKNILMRKGEGNAEV